MRKRKSKPAKVYRLDIGKKGRKSIPALLPLLDEKDLKISRSYYNKLLRKVKAGENLPPTIATKVEKLKNYRNKHVIELKDGTTTNVHVEQYLKNILKKNKEKDFIWVKIKLGSAGRVYTQSFVIPKADLKKTDKAINDYLAVKVKKYDKFPVYVYEISVQNV